MASDGQPLSHILNDGLLKTIFNNAEVIYNINNTLLTKLEKRWQGWNYDSKIGDVFLSTVSRREKNRKHYTHVFFLFRLSF